MSILNDKDQPLRVLHVVTYMGRGGIETMLMNYYRNIDRSKIQFDFLVHRDFRADFDDEIETLGGRIYRVPPMNPLSRDYNKSLEQFFNTHLYRVVHCHLNYMSGVVLAKAKKAGVPVRIAHAHTAAMNPGWKQIVRKFLKFLIPKTATDCFACSETAGNSVFGNHKYKMMMNAIDSTRFNYDSNVRVEQRKAFQLEDEFTIMHVGRMVYPKNHTFLLDVFSELLKYESQAKLLCAGDGELRRKIEQKASSLPEGSVRFLGVRDDVPELLQAADVFVFPSHFEGLPVTLIEAQAAGLPCIKSENVTDEAVVTDLVTSLPLEDPRAWAEAILKKRTTPRLDQTQAIIDSGYDIHAAARKLENFYLNGEPL